MIPPDGFREVRAVGARGFARAEAVEWITSALTRWGSLARAGAHADDALELHGRSTVHAVPAPDGGRWVIRRYRRGGWIASLLDDRYLRQGTPRPLLETRASQVARGRGVATPKIIAGVVYPGGLFYRADLVSEYVPDSLDLAEMLFGGDDGRPDGTDPALRAACLEGAGQLAVRLAAAGVRHRDFNAKNVLVQLGDEAPRMLALDLDRATVHRRGSVDAGGMGARLERSLRKFERRTDRFLREQEWQALARGLDISPEQP